MKKKPIILLLPHPENPESRIFEEKCNKVAGLNLMLLREDHGCVFMSAGIVFNTN